MEHPLNPPTANFRSDLNRLLLEFGRDYERRVMAEIHRSGHSLIRPAHCSIFTHLGLGAVRVTELADRTHVTQQAMGKMLKELERIGYVVRDIDNHDRRAKKIRPTERGREVMNILDASVDKIRDYYADLVGDEVLQDLERLLSKCIRKVYGGELGRDAYPTQSGQRNTG